MKRILFSVVFGFVSLIACQTNVIQSVPTRVPTAVANVPTVVAVVALPATMTVAATTTAVGSSSATANEPATATLTPTATATLYATATLTTPDVTPTATYWPTVTRQVLAASVASGLAPCAQRAVENDLLTLVTQQFALPSSYVPADLVPLAEYFDSDVTRGQALFVRAVIVEPLQRMVAEMQAAGLRPSILSAYRGYDEQALAWQWWSNQYPGRVAIMSARPGNSEHQLGTTVDFGSPEIDHLFHVDFADTAEGVWLAENAHRFGFTLSFPPTAYATTGFKHEPWHFRYVGVELATALRDSGLILTQWQLANQPPPCIP